MKLKQMSILLFSSSLALVACDSCNESESVPASEEDAVTAPESTPEAGMTGETEMAAPDDQAQPPEEGAPPVDGSYGTDEGTPPAPPAEEMAPEGADHQEVPPPAEMPAPEGSGE